MEELGISLADEIDGRDKDGMHLLLRCDEIPVGTARILVEDQIGKIGRVAVLSTHRGKGFGQELMLAALSALRDVDGVTHAKLGARTNAIGFYEGLGFTATGPEFMDAGLPHRTMIRAL